MSVAYITFKVVLRDQDGNEITLPAKVEWLQGGDNDVRVVTYVDVGTGEVLDKWEGSNTSLEVSIEPLCFNVYGDNVDCPGEVKDYLEQSGKASLSWVYNPNGDSSIYLKFTEVVE